MVWAGVGSRVAGVGEAEVSSYATDTAAKGEARTAVHRRTRAVHTHTRAPTRTRNPLFGYLQMARVRRAIVNERSFRNNLTKLGGVKPYSRS